MIQCLYMLEVVQNLEGDIVKDSQWEGLTGTNNVIPESFEKNDSFQNKNNQEFDKKMQDMINERSKIKQI